MSLRMPAPWRNPSTGIFYLRVRLPADLVGMKGSRISVPVADGWRTLQVGDAIKVSLGTREPGEAKQRHHAAMAHLETLFAAKRRPAMSLTHRQIAALASEAHVGFVKALEDNPAFSAAFWREQADQLRLAREGRDGPYGHLVIPLRDVQQTDSFLHTIPASVLEGLERHVGVFVDQALRKHALIVDGRSRAALLDWTAREVAMAMDRVAGMAEGDYSPDPNEGRRPVFIQAAAQIDNSTVVPAAPQPAAPAGDRDKFNLLNVVEDYFAEIQEGGRRQDRGRGAIKRWKPVFAGIVKFTGKSDIRQYTPQDFVNWKDHRLGSGISAQTFVKADRAALKAVFTWAVSNNRIETDPVKVRVAQSAAPRSREKGFSQDEAIALLRAAIQRPAAAKELAETTAALRWMPWLMAYTGSRPTEMAQLRKEDICLSGDIPTLRISPDAGAVKTNQVRTVPIHPHLIELGFGRYVESRPDGPLFHQPDTPPSRVSGKVSTAARAIVTDEAVQPNYGWRHRFKTITQELDCNPRVVDAIQGHAPRTAGETYGDVTPKAMLVGVISRLPRYEVDQA